MKKSLQFILFLLLPYIGRSQHLEAGLLAGVSNYIGDLSKNSATIYLGETQPALGILARYNLSEMLAIRAGLNYTWVSGTDANVRRDDYIRQRNLSFKSKIMELALIGEINIPGYQPYALSSPFSPYLFGGVAFFSFNPTTRYKGNKVELQPLGTEGQSANNRYALSSFAIPFGGGVKYALSDKINVGAELGFRLTFTDYLDDVSGNYMSYPELLALNGEMAANLGNRTGELTGGEPVIVPTGTQRGDQNPRDWYMTLGITVTYNFLDNGLMGSRRRNTRGGGCSNSRF